MIESDLNTHDKANHKKGPDKSKVGSHPSKNILLTCKAAVKVINQLCHPIDSVNRFINLALQSLEESSQSRQFLLESKEGIRRTSFLLKKLNNYSKRIEQEIQRMPADDE